MIDRRSFVRRFGTLSLLPLAARGARRAARKISLLTTFIAGFRFHEGICPEVFQTLAEGDELTLVREHNNRYDPLAIAVRTRRGHKLGYIPATVNSLLANILDQEATIGAEILEIDAAAPPWERVRIGTYLWVHDQH